MTPEQANAVPGFTSIVQLLFAFKKKIKPSFVHPTLFVAKVATFCAFDIVVAFSADVKIPGGQRTAHDNKKAD